MSAWNSENYFTVAVVEPIPDTDEAWVREPHAKAFRMKMVDVTPCTVCRLRGHVAGDPVKCLHGEVRGLGGEQREQSKIGGHGR